MKMPTRRGAIITLLGVLLVLLAYFGISIFLLHDQMPPKPNETSATPSKTQDAPEKSQPLPARKTTPAPRGEPTPIEVVKTDSKAARVDLALLAQVLARRSTAIANALARKPARSRELENYQAAETTPEAIDDHVKMRGLLVYDAPDQATFDGVLREALSHLLQATDREAFGILLEWLARQDQKQKAQAAQILMDFNAPNPSAEQAIIEERLKAGHWQREFGEHDITGYRALCLALGMDGVAPEKVYDNTIMDAHSKGVLLCLQSESRPRALPALLALYAGVKTSFGGFQDFAPLRESEAAIKRCGGELPNPADALRKTLADTGHLHYWEAHEVFDRLGASSHFQNLGQAVNAFLELLPLFPDDDLMSNGINLGAGLVHNFNDANAKRGGALLASDVHALLDQYEKAKPAHRYALAGAIFASAMRVKDAGVAKRILKFIEEDFPNPVEGASNIWASYMAIALYKTDHEAAMRDLKAYFYKDYPEGDQGFEAAVAMFSPFLSNIKWTQTEALRPEILEVLQHFFTRDDFLKAGYSNIGNDFLYEAIVELNWREAPEAIKKLLATGEEKKVAKRIIERFQSILTRLEEHFAAKSD